MTIAKHKSISKAVDELYPIQSVPNQQLLKSETELGAPLFVHTRNHWELIEIGKLYVKRSQQIFQIKKQTYSQIQDITKKRADTIATRLTPERGVQMFTAIYPITHAKYPRTILQPIEASVDTQAKVMDSKETDISFQTIFERKYKHLMYETIFYEPFYLCIPKIHPLAHKEKTEPDQYPEMSLSLFKNELFTLVKKSSTMYVVIDQLFKKSGFEPNLLFESASMRTMFRLTENSQCCSIIPRYYALPNSHVSYSSLGPDASWKLAVVHAWNHYINNAAKDFMRMAVTYWRAHPYSD